MAPMEALTLLSLCSRGWQGGGLFISGTATLTNTNVDSNTASYVRACTLELPRPFLHCPSGRLRAPPFGLQGGGIAIYGPGGTATLINTNVYSNEATYVCWPFLPLPRPFFQCPLELTLN